MRRSIILGSTALIIIACGGKGEGTAEPLSVNGTPASPIRTGAPIGVPGTKQPGGGTGNTTGSGGITGSGGATGGDCMSACAALAQRCEQSAEACGEFCNLGPDVQCLQTVSCEAVGTCVSTGTGGTTGSGGTPPTGGAGGVGATGGTSGGCTPADNCANCPDQNAGPSECFEVCTCAVSAGIAPAGTDCQAACFGSG